MNNQNITKVIVAGEGGQGVQSIAHILTKAAFAAGLNVSFLPNYGVEQRGGVSLGFIQFGKGIIGFPKFSQADILLVMRDRAIERTKRYIGSNTLYIYDSDLIKADQLSDIYVQKLPISATSTANQKLDPKVFNIILLGAIVAECGLIKDKFIESEIDNNFADKYKIKPQFKYLNKKAFEIGKKLTKEVYR
ncbi:MAG: 2-oxoacid:acceptor oxidoreductase family protein [Patescibacteria group bacterium]|jgi:2-oxoglutarate ferredoxin oxidoreductase subunit gamma|nr:2-oxoacid:acceptor oxidoreductase family protein [Patescibacteria group bacterium]